MKNFAILFLSMVLMGILGLGLGFVLGVSAADKNCSKARTFEVEREVFEF